MKTPVVLVAFSLAMAMAILFSASLLIVTGARGENALRGVSGQSLPVKRVACELRRARRGLAANFLNAKYMSNLIC